MGRRQIGVVGCPVCFIVIDVEIEPVVGVRTIELDVTQLECCALGANYQPFIEVVGALCASGAGSRRSAVGPRFVHFSLFSWLRKLSQVMGVRGVQVSFSRK